MPNLISGTSGGTNILNPDDDAGGDDHLWISTFISDTYIVLDSFSFYPTFRTDPDAVVAACDIDLLINGEVVYSGRPTVLVSSTGNKEMPVPIDESVKKFYPAGTEFSIQTYNYGSQITLYRPAISGATNITLTENHYLNPSTDPTKLGSNLNECIKFQMTAVANELESLHWQYNAI